jgi:hypothetical protein
MKLRVPQFELKRCERNEVYEQLVNGLGVIGLFYAGVSIRGSSYPILFLVIAIISMLLVYVRIEKSR